MARPGSMWALQTSTAGTLCTIVLCAHGANAWVRRLAQIRLQQTAGSSHINAEDTGTVSVGDETSPCSMPAAAPGDTLTPYEDSPYPVPRQGSDWPGQGDVALATLSGQLDSGVAGSVRAEPSFPSSYLGDISALDNHVDTEYWLPDRLSNQPTTFNLLGDSSFVDFALPLVIDTEVEDTSIDMPQASLPLYHGISDMPSGFEEVSAPWPSYINEPSIIPWIDVYFDRLHPTLPVLSHSSLFTRILRQEHRQNPLFGSMLLSLCAFAITQPIFISERSSSSSRERQAKRLMTEAIRMRSSSNFGEYPTLEAVLTSFFLFGCLFGSNQHNAAWLRLREAIDLAQTMGLNDLKTYQYISSEAKGERLRTYLVLSITERRAECKPSPSGL